VIYYSVRCNTPKSLNMGYFLQRIPWNSMPADRFIWPWGLVYSSAVSWLLSYELAFNRTIPLVPFWAAIVLTNSDPREINVTCYLLGVSSCFDESRSSCSNCWADGRWLPLQAREFYITTGLCFKAVHTTSDEGLKPIMRNSTERWGKTWSGIILPIACFLLLTDTVKYFVRIRRWVHPSILNSSWIKYRWRVSILTMC